MWILACDQGSLVRLCVQDYKSLCAAVTNCANLIDIQTDTHRDSRHFDQLIRTAQSAELNIRTVWNYAACLGCSVTVVTDVSTRERVNRNYLDSQ